MGGGGGRQRRGCREGRGRVRRTPRSTHGASSGSGVRGEGRHFATRRKGQGLAVAKLQSVPGTQTRGSWEARGGRPHPGVPTPRAAPPRAPRGCALGSPSGSRRGWGRGGDPPPASVSCALAFADRAPRETRAEPQGSAAPGIRPAEPTGSERPPPALEGHLRCMLTSLRH